MVALPSGNASSSSSSSSSSSAAASAADGTSKLSVLSANDDDESDSAGDHDSGSGSSSISGGVVLRLEAGRAATVVVRFRSDREGLCSAVARMTPLLEGATAVHTRLRADGAVPGCE